MKQVKITLLLPESIRLRLFALKAKGIDINMTKLLIAGALLELQRLENLHGGR